LTNLKNKRITYIEVQNKVLKALILFVVLLSAFLFFAKNSYAESCPTQNQNPCWIEKSSMPIPRWGIAASSDANGNIYVVGGYDGNGIHAFNNLDVFDPAQNKWFSKNSAPIQLNLPGFAFSNVNNKFYLVGGFTSVGIINNVFEYNPTLDQWTVKNSIPLAIQQAKLIEGKNGKLYSIGGITNAGCFGNVFEYNPLTDSWTTKASMTIERCDPAVAIDANGIIYAIGGYRDNRFNSEKTTAVEAYNPGTNTWTIKSPIPQNRYNANGSASINANGKIYLIGGATGNLSNSQTNTVYEYDPTSDTWTQKSSIPVARDLSQLIYSNGKIYSIGGRISDSPEIASGLVYEGFTPDILSQDLNLSVPLYKQTDSAWGSQTYDSADDWNPTDSRIYAWGCAMTSAAMVFRYYGLNKLPGNVELNPGTLNDWLKKQKDGYVDKGRVNWISLSRLSKQAAGINHIKNFDALEFTKIYSNDNEVVKNDLKENIPDILGVPGHFIVAKGISNNIITINDPGFNRTSLLNYSNTFQTINRFTPSHTDLSYIMITYNPEINLKLQDSNGNELGKYFTEDPIVSVSDGLSTNGDPFKFVLLQKPEAQDYKIILGSPSNTTYSIGIYLYDKSGEVLKNEKSGNLIANQTTTIPFYFDGQADLYPKKISFGKFDSDLNKNYRKDVLDSGLYLNLSSLLSSANAYHKDNNDIESLKKLIEFEKLLTQNSSLINLDAFNVLLYDVNYLETHL